MGNEFDIQKYMSDGVERVVKEAVRAAFKHPEQAAFLANFAVASKKASVIRASAERRGEHIPPFLIASITSRCNLHCKGCYSRENGETDDCAPSNQLTAGEWYKIFSESEKLGISFILLAGGEPLLRKDVILEAVKIPNIFFPIFTNGVFMNDEYFELFSEYHNLVPVIADSGHLTLNENHQSFLREEVARLRRDTPEMVFISFPGDEKTSEGCVAAGRGFFHINSRGGAEPCPFSPFSDINVKETSVREALKSPLFSALQAGNFLKDDHVGGCTLFAKKDKVEKLIQKMITG